MVKKVLACHDISCYGRCSMQVVVPALSHFGLQVCPLPTALLSTHTGGFEAFTFLDLTSQMADIIAHWEKLGLSFQAIYSGFLGNEKQIDMVLQLEKCFCDRDGIVLIDPVMGDNGEIYRTYTRHMCDKMHLLCENATVITPNLTEAYMLVGREYNPCPSETELKVLMAELTGLCKKGKKAVLISGVRRGDRIATVYYDSLVGNAEHGIVYSEYCSKFYPGCGDLLASLLLGALLNGGRVKESLEKATAFISKAAFETERAGTPYMDGLEFEELLIEYRYK